VVVVENGSGDASLARITSWAAQAGIAHETLPEGAPALASGSGSWLTFVVSSSNRGFAGGNNLGIALLERDPSLSHFLLLNNDATVEPEYFARLADALGTVPDTALLSGTVYEGLDRSRPWYAGGKWLALRSLAEHLLEPPPAAAPMETEFVSGCTMLVARPTLARIGKLAECYFPGYWEDGEYSWRARAAGLRLVYAPAAVAYHKVNASFGRIESPALAFAKQRHRALFIRRNYRGLLRLGAIGYLLVTKPGRAIVEALRGRPRRGWAIFSGMVSGLRAPVSPRDTVGAALSPAAYGRP
jgi:GT2 family glycosyltransferase